MSEDNNDEAEERTLDPGRLVDGTQRAESDRHHVFVVPREPVGRVYFKLLSEFGEREFPNREFTLEGDDIEVHDRTDHKAEFTLEPAEYGEYTLTVGDESYEIPAVAWLDPPHPVNIRYITLEDEDDAWDEPFEEEIAASPEYPLDEEPEDDDSDDDSADDSHDDDDPEELTDGDA